MALFRSIVQTKVIAAAQVHQVILKKLPLNCKIILDEKKCGPGGVFFPGNEIHGRIDASYNEEITFCGLRLSLDGYIKVKYILNDKDKYERKVTILTQTEYVYGTSGPVKITMTPGTKGSYLFTLSIPPDNIPQTFTSQFGTIYYQLVLYADYGNEKYSKKSCKEITVMRKMDLEPFDDDCAVNNEPVTIAKYDEKSCKQITYKKKSMDSVLKLTFKLEHQQYIRGDKIPFQLFIRNPKDRYKIKEASVRLLQRITYSGAAKPSTFKITNHPVATAIRTAEDEAKESENKEISFDDEDTGNNKDEKCWKGILETPKDLYPSGKSLLIEFQYFVKVMVKVISGGESLSEECPIIIGTTREGLTADDEEAAAKFYEINGKRANRDGDEEYD